MLGLKNSGRRNHTAGFLALSLAIPVLTPGAAAQTASESSFDRLWGHATLFEDTDGGFLQTFALRGRLQADAARYEADQGDFSDILWRRFRFGFKAGFSQDWVLHVEGDWNLNDDDNETNPEESFNRLTDAYIGWNPGETWGVKVLKQSAGFTLDGATSSTELLTLQRNNLTNNLWFTTEYFTGVSVSGRAPSPWSWRAAVFSSDVDQDLSLFEAGAFGLLSLGRDFGEDLGLDRAVVRMDYVHNEEHEDAGTRSFSQVPSFVTKWEQGKWGLWTDVSAGKGYADQSDVWGVALMPFFEWTPKLQLVLRYTWIKSAGDNGVRLGRYEREIAGGRGDEYDEIYAGLNWFFHGHQLKWQAGLQYSDMNDLANDGGAYEGWGFTTGLRLSW